MFLFDHPCPSHLIEPSKHTRLSFDIPHSSLLHGFGGYFDSKLYGDVHISIAPHSFTDEMFSWFPLYIPITTPVYLAAGSKLIVDMWRVSGTKQVWYEWSFSVGDFQ